MSLESASISIYGRYNNERESFRPISVDVATKDVDREQFIAAMSHILESMQTAEDALPVGDRRFGYSDVRVAGNEAIKASGFSERLIENIAVSEITPEWAVEASPEEIISVAGLMIAARKVARYYHRLGLWAVNSD